MRRIERERGRRVGAGDAVPIVVRSEEFAARGLVSSCGSRGRRRTEVCGKSGRGWWGC